MELKVLRLDPEAQLPTRAHIGDLGYDLYALEDVTLNPGEVTKVRTGIACNFPSDVGALIRDRSSVATKQQVFVVAGVIDQGYTGEIIVAFHNPISWVRSDSMGNNRQVLQSGEIKSFKKGDKIAQLVLVPITRALVQEVDTLAHTTRGDRGFGSTGQ